MTSEEIFIHENLRYDTQDGQFYWRKTIRLVSGVVLVSEGDKAGSSDGGGYIRIALAGKRHLAHRLVWFLHNGKWPTHQLDHIDRDKQNNRIENLRQCTASENQRNRGMTKSNTSGHVGVSFLKKDNKYMARIKHNRRLIYLGLFLTAQDASQAYQAARRVYFGTFGEDHSTNEHRKMESRQ